MKRLYLVTTGYSGKIIRLSKLQAEKYRKNGYTVTKIG